MGSKVEICVLVLYITDSDYISFSKIPVSRALAAKHPVVPLRLFTKNGDVIIIDSVKDISRVASMKAGGLGDRYTCLATLGEQQREIYVYKDQDTWFLEEEF